MSVYSPPSPTVARSAPSRAMPALMSACVVVVVAMVASINLALPKLSSSDLHPSSTQLLWIVEAYILVSAGCSSPQERSATESSCSGCPGKGCSCSSDRSRSSSPSR